MYFSLHTTFKTEFGGLFRITHKEGRSVTLRNLKTGEEMENVPISSLVERVNNRSLRQL